MVKIPYLPWSFDRRAEKTAPSCERNKEQTSKNHLFLIRDSKRPPQSKP